MVYKIWKNIGRVRVTRDDKGRFTTWHKVRGYKRREPVTTRIPVVVKRGAEPKIDYSEFMGKYVAVYGTAFVNGRLETRRYEIYGPGRDLYQAVREAVMHPPITRFLRIRADDFMVYPERFESGGYWVAREVES